MLRLFAALLLAALLAARYPVQAQHALHWEEVGAFAAENFGPGDYAADPQNWGVAMDGRGVLYTANSGGVLEYDGVTWRLIPVPGGGTVRTVAVDARDRVFVGAQGELGMVAPDHSGTPRYHSFLPLLPPALRAFESIRSTIATPEGVYFSSERGLFRWSEGGGMRVWALPGSGRRLGYLKGRLYVHERERGLLVLSGDSLAGVPGGHLLAGLQGSVLLPRSTGDLLILTRTGGFFVFDGTRVVPLALPADVLVREAQVMDGALLPGGLLALATLRRGLVVLGPDGHVLRALDRDAGLRDSDAKAVLRSPSGGLWVGLNNGLARVALPAPLTYFGAQAGTGAFVVAAARHAGRLYVATSQGVRYLDTPTTAGAAPAFRAVPGLPEFCHALLSTPNGLLGGCDHGVFVVSPAGAVPVPLALESAFTLAASARHPDRVYVGLNDGLAVLDWREGRWVRAGRVAGIQTEVRHIVEGDGEQVWIGTNHRGLYRALVPAEVARARAAPVGPWPEAGVRVFATSRGPLFSTPDGLLRLDARASASPFVPDTLVAPFLPADQRQLLHLAETAEGHFWLFAGRGLGVLRRGSRGYRWQAVPAQRLPLPAYALYPEPGGAVWIGLAEGLARYDAAVERLPAPRPTTLIRQVALTGRDSVLYGGSGPAVPPRLGASLRDLRFSYTAPGVAGARYQVRLDGLDARWSDWTDEVRKDYTNLPAGTYTFRVRSRAGSDEAVGPEATYTFILRPAWFATGWAYALYALLAALLMWALLKLNTARLHARNRHLEALVHARTAEVEGQKAQLQAQNVQIEEQTAQLRRLDEAKSRFFANVSHEFRTPLTLTLGPIEDLLEGYHGALPDAARASLDVARQSAYRLLRLVSRLLDLAKLESGQMTLEAQPRDLVAFLHGVAAAFVPLARRRGLTFTCTASVPHLTAHFDAEKLEEVTVNLLSNSFKATPPGGRVGVSLDVVDGWAEIRVADTGTGIEPESLGVIFDRFQQGRAALPGTVGTGIGLNLVQELVHLHGGTVIAESVLGAGSVFVVRLPLPADAALVLPAASGDGEPAASALPQPALPPKGETDPAFALPLEAARPHPVAIPHRDDHPTVLVVDDNADVRAYVRQHLESRYHVAEAADGEEGYAQARALLPDLIVSDVMMPRRDGYSLCRALKADPVLDHVPVILLTAKASADSKIEGLDAAADDYLTKPFNARELLARVRNLIALRQRLRDKYRSAEASPLPDAPLSDPAPPALSAADAALLDEVRATIERHLPDPDFAVEALADAAALSVSQLQRRVKALTGLTPVQLVKTMRLARAASLLAQRAGTVSEVAYAVGFNSHAYFAQSFREQYGVTPSAYGSTVQAASAAE